MSVFRLFPFTTYVSLSESVPPLCSRTLTPTPRLAVGHSAPILANAEALLEILTARELEAFLRIDVKTIYSYVQRGLIPHMRIESNVRFSETLGPTVAPGAHLRAPTSEWQGR
jgi:hypothetical protein